MIRIILQSLRYYWRTHLGTVAAATVATAAIVGALAVGDSVRATLRHIALARLGDTHLALASGDRFFTASLVEKIRHASGYPTAGLLSLRGIAVEPEKNSRTGGVNVLGVSKDFWSLGDPLGDPPAPGQALLSRRLAEELQAGAGDRILLRLAKPTALSADIALAREANETITLSLTVQRVLEDRWPARFNLKADQIAPLNAWVAMETLQREAGLTQRANLILVGATDLKATPPAHPHATVAGVEPAHRALRESWTLEDAQLELRRVPGADTLELRTARVFLDPQVADAAPPDGRRIVTYFVNELSTPAGKSTPYSVVTALDPRQSELVPDNLKENEVVITDWLAEDLGVKIGDPIRLKYYVTGDGRKLTEQTARFAIRAVVPVEGPGGDRDLMPEFPGLTDADSPLDWKPPADLNVDLKKIRKKDEAYWKRHRGAPKAFVSLDWARKHWSTRFGTYTAIRWPADSASIHELETAIRKRLDPASLRLFGKDVRTPALAAAEQGYDFGQLFIGFSFFLIIAAMLLTALMFAFCIEQRTPQIGTLLALGWTHGQVRRLLLGEAAGLAVVGGVLGWPLGLLYTRTMLWALANLWQGATALPSLQYHAQPLSQAVGVTAGLLTALLSMGWVLSHQGRQSVRQLLAARYGFETASRKSKVPLFIGWILATASAVMLGMARSSQHQAPVFFGSGSLLLLALIFLGWFQFSPRRPARSGELSVTRLGLTNAVRRRGRSLATVSMLACGTFLLIAVNAFRHGPHEAPQSATLGFEIFAQSSLPVHHDLNTPAGGDQYGLSEENLRGVRIVQARLKEGDEASCLNLNRPQNPPLLGVDPAKMPDEVWKLLIEKPHPLPLPKGEGSLQPHPLPLSKGEGSLQPHPLPLSNGPGPEGEESDVIPALVDASVAQWVLHVKVGDTIEYTDDRGRPFAVKIAATLPKSILQGFLVINEEHFKQKFPAESGYRVLLVDAPAERAQSIRQVLNRALADVGITSMATADRLAMFNAVENTYLSIFGVLGGLGVLVGCVGVGLVVLRNALERRGELAVMAAMGFSSGAIRRLLIVEHAGLVLMGVLCGLIPALIAVSPAVTTLERGFPYQILCWTLAAILLSALLWVLIAAALAVQGRLIASLRSE